jgi:hypothetical protein
MDILRNAEAARSLLLKWPTTSTSTSTPVCEYRTASGFGILLVAGRDASRTVAAFAVVWGGEIYVMFSQLSAIAASRLFLARPRQLGLDTAGRFLTSKEAAQIIGLRARSFYERAS